ncbi:hypothetical protein BDR22DRAFT_895171 [Usnea florida]
MTICLPNEGRTISVEPRRGKLLAGKRDPDPNSPRPWLRKNTYPFTVDVHNVKAWDWIQAKINSRQQPDAESTDSDTTSASAASILPVPASAHATMSLPVRNRTKPIDIGAWMNASEVIAVADRNVDEQARQAAKEQEAKSIVPAAITYRETWKKVGGGTGPREIVAVEMPQAAAAPAPAPALLPHQRRGPPAAPAEMPPPAPKETPTPHVLPHLRRPPPPAAEEMPPPAPKETPTPHVLPHLRRPPPPAPKETPTPYVLPHLRRPS